MPEAMAVGLAQKNRLSEMWLVNIWRHTDVWPCQDNTLASREVWRLSDVSNWSILELGKPDDAKVKRS